jgi:putative Mg2+ transporter-C (MgtC) family protein
MQTLLTWPEIAIRLACALAVGALLGVNRSEHGRAAGLRTSMLVCVAACVSMVQVNLLLPLAGRSPNSFVMNDLMRLPLGILSGMGFIGAGAIVRRGNLVTGVTTAATLWFLTVVGLCFGGGQIALGTAAGAIGIAILSVFSRVEDRMKQDRRGNLRLTIIEGGPREEEVRAALGEGGIHVYSVGLSTSRESPERELRCELHWRTRRTDTAIPGPIQRLTSLPGVVRADWTPQAQ